MMTNKLGLYLHIPFCVKKCGYCDFLSYPPGEGEKKAYVSLLRKEIRLWKGKTDCPVDSVFFGGGTPSLLEGQELEQILECLRDVFVFEKDCEITLESNPGTLDEEKLRDFKRLGINRLSLGVQSFQDDILRFLGRIHTADQALTQFELARKAGFSNINLDLMFSLPGLSMQGWEKTLRRALSLEPEHLSYYGLILEEGTPFYQAYEEGRLGQEDEELDRRQYWYTVDTLAGRGYRPYEISNAARDGLACRHNLKYWSLSPYLGFGLGAHSYFEGRRMENTRDPRAYQRALEEERALSEEGECPDGFFCPPCVEKLHLNTLREDMEEFMFLGLRKTEGVKLSRFERRFGVDFFQVYPDQVKKLKGRGLLAQEGDRLFLTPRGIDISNSVMCEFLF